MMRRIYCWLCAVVLLVGCGDDGGAMAGSGGTPNTGGSGGSAATGGTGTGGMGGTGAGGTGGEPLPQVLDPVPGDPAFAVVSTDFVSSAISLLDEDGEVLADDWLTSGSTWPTLVAALSGDVALPTQQRGDGSLVVIDRFQTDVISRFQLSTGGLFGQVRTQGTSDVASFSSNPHDCVFISDSSAWVSRYEPSFEPNPAPDVAGNDLYEIDPTTMTLKDGRIDFSPFNEEIDEVTIYARPNRIVRLGDYLVVGLDGFSEFFDAALPGKVVIVDIETGDATEYSLGAVKNCGNVAPIPGEDDLVVVSCGGASPTFDAAERRMTAGLFVLQVDAEGAASTIRSWLPSGDPGAASTVAAVVPMNDREVIAVENGDFATVTDAAYLVDIETGGQTLLFDIAGSFEIGQGAYDPATELVLIPVSTEGVRRFDVTGGIFTPLSTTPVSGAPLGPAIVSSLR